MNSVTLQLAPNTVQLLRQKAAQRGESLEAFLQQLADREAVDGTSPANSSESDEDVASLFPPPDETIVRAALADFEAGRFRTQRGRSSGSSNSKNEGSTSSAAGS